MCSVSTKVSMSIDRITLSVRTKLLQYQSNFIWYDFFCNYLMLQVPSVELKVRQGKFNINYKQHVKYLGQGWFG